MYLCPKINATMKIEKQLSLCNIMMSNGKVTAAEWLLTQPKKYRMLATEAIYVCLKKGWPMNKMEIQGIAREIEEKMSPKGW
jgi:hypothetical protein